MAARAAALLAKLAVGLALAGWPLVRSAEEWKRSRASDGGPPESLAHKIVLWEAWERKHGYRVETPTIPGLKYATWEEIEAQRSAEAAEAEGT